MKPIFQPPNRVSWQQYCIQRDAAARTWKRAAKIWYETANEYMFTHSRTVKALLDAQDERDKVKRAHNITIDLAKKTFLGLKARIKELEVDNQKLEAAFLESETITKDGKLAGSVPKLQAEIERLRAENDELRSKVVYWEEKGYYTPYKGTFVVPDQNAANVHNINVAADKKGEENG